MKESENEKNYEEYEEKKNSNSKKKKHKVKAWCGECFQFFENGPLTKVCKEHVNKGKCNLIDCKKQSCLKKDKDTCVNAGIICIRKFPNTNSENRHTYCISEDDVKIWEEQCNIQNILGVKRSSDINYEKCKFNCNLLDGEVDNTCIIDSKSMISEISVQTLNEEEIKNLKTYLKEEINNKNENNEKNKLQEQKNIEIKNKINFNINCLKTENDENKDNRLKELIVKDKVRDVTVNLNFENLIPNQNYKNYEYNLIDEINNLNFLEGDKFSLDDNLINEFNKIYFNTPSIENKMRESKSIQTDENNEKVDDHKNRADKIVELDTIKFMNENKVEIQETFEFNNQNKISDHENIDEIFERIHTETKIPKSILNKLKSAFKKKGIFNAKILRLFKNKNKNLNFIVNELKLVCPQIEAVALFLENIL